MFYRGDEPELQRCEYCGATAATTVTVKVRKATEAWAACQPCANYLAKAA